MDIEKTRKLYLDTKLNKALNILREDITMFVEKGLLTYLFRNVLDITMSFPTESLKQSLSRFLKMTPEELANYSFEDLLTNFSQRTLVDPEDVYQLIVSKGVCCDYIYKYQTSKYYTNFYRPVVMTILADKNGNVSSERLMKFYYTVVFGNLSAKIKRILTFVDIKGSYEKPLKIVVEYVSKMMELKLSDNSINDNLVGNIKRIVSYMDYWHNSFSNELNEKIHEELMIISKYLSKMPLKKGLSEDDVKMFYEITRNDVVDVIC